MVVLTVYFTFESSNHSVVASGAIGGKTGKTAVLPGFFEIERGNGSGGGPLCYRGLIWFGRARHTGATPVHGDL